MSFIVLIDENNWGNPKVLREDGKAVTFATRDDAWIGVRDVLPEMLLGTEWLNNCECEDGGESCPPCDIDGHIRAFIADHDSDGEFVHEYLPGEVVRVEVQPAGHYHVYRGDLEVGAGNPIIGLENAFQAVSDETDRLADEWDQMAYAHGHEGDRLQHADQPADSQYAKAWKLIMEASRLRTISQNFDLATRREAPLFQGEDGAERWKGTLKHLMNTHLRMIKETDGGVIETRVNYGSVCVFHHDIPECWEEQEF